MSARGPLRVQHGGRVARHPGNLKGAAGAPADDKRRGRRLKGPHVGEQGR